MISMKRAILATAGIFLLLAVVSCGTKPVEKSSGSSSILVTPNATVTQTPPASNTTQGTVVGNVAPNFQLQSLDGKTISLNDLRGKPVMLTFWATWCPFCRIEMPTIQKAYEEWQNKGFVVLTIDIIDSTATETADNLASFMNTNNYSFPVLLDTKMQVTRTYNIKSTPTSLFIDKDGVIREIKIGVSSKETFDASLNQLLLK